MYLREIRGGETIRQLVVLVVLLVGVGVALAAPGPVRAGDHNGLSRLTARDHDFTGYPYHPRDKFDGLETSDHRPYDYSRR
jgi:hypothetical protein